MYTHHKFDHEFPGDITPTAAFVVCSVPRSGSSLLCELLALTGLAGAPSEFFDHGLMNQFSAVWGTGTFGDYMAALLSKKTSPNGVFGVKTHHHQLEYALRHTDFIDALPNPRFIYIKRHDHLRQAVSWMRAEQTGLWASDHRSSGGQPQFDRDKIRHLVEWIEREEASGKLSSGAGRFRP